MPLESKGFVRTYVLPALFLFALPLFAHWFAGYATVLQDARTQSSIIEHIKRRNDIELSEGARQAAIDFYRRNAPSTLCKTESAATLGELCMDFVQFEWMKGAALVSLGIGALSVLLALVCAALSFTSRSAQYMTFLVGLHSLRVTSALQTLLQGGLAPALSYWMSAVLLHVYSLKLILIVGLAGAVAAFRVIGAIFSKVGGPHAIEGKLLSEEDAPELWTNVRALCQRLETTPPDQIVAGIDDNFFVTEGEVGLGDKRLEGRTLYVSLSLVRTLERSEADAVLAHEMAHFSGGDTAYSKKLVPLLQRYGVYLQALAEGLVTRPIFYFMLFYFGLFQLSLGRQKRQREYRADSIAASVTSPLDIVRALVKVGAYSSFRGRVEEQLFAEKQVQGRLGIAERVTQQFAEYASSPKLAFDLHHAQFPHPFDSHPSLSERMAAVGARLPESDYAELLSKPVESSWSSTIANAEAIEAEQWQAYEARFTRVHEVALAYRFRPSNDEELAVVTRHFPPQEVTLKSGTVVRIDHEKVQLSEGGNPIHFSDIKGAAIGGTILKKYVELDVRLDLEKSDRSVVVSDEAEGNAFLALFHHYYERHCVMEKYQKTGEAA